MVAVNFQVHTRIGHAAKAPNDYLAFVLPFPQVESSSQASPQIAICRPLLSVSAITRDFSCIAMYAWTPEASNTPSLLRLSRSERYVIIADISSWAAGSSYPSVSIHPGCQIETDVSDAGFEGKLRECILER